MVPEDFRGQAGFWDMQGAIYSGVLKASYWEKKVLFLRERKSLEKTSSISKFVTVLLKMFLFYYKMIIF